MPKKSDAREDSEATTFEEMFGIREEKGWKGVFTRRQAVSALYPNGMQIQKTFCEDGDVTPKGTGGTVLGSIQSPIMGVGYFIEWADKPRVAVFTIERKIGLVG